jgi:hypothetical protein
MFRFLFRFVPYQFVGAVIDVLRYLLSKVWKIDPDKIQNLIDAINRDLIKDDRYNRYVLENKELLENRINAELDRAIERYNDLTGDPEDVTIESPTFTEDLEGDTPLGGELRLTAPYKKDYEL